MGFPTLKDTDRLEGLRLARCSTRRRYAKIMHERGSYHNAAFNFMLRDSYMQPHQHPGSEKIEEIRILEGQVKILIFDDNGKVISKQILSLDQHHIVQVPAFTWHTYVICTDFAITYETMSGVYEPHTWKRFACWAPAEDSDGADLFLESLKNA